MCVLSTLYGNVDKHSPFDIYIYIYIYDKTMLVIKEPVSSQPKQKSVNKCNNLYRGYMLYVQHDQIILVVVSGTNVCIKLLIIL